MIQEKFGYDYVCLAKAVCSYSSTHTRAATARAGWPSWAGSSRRRRRGSRRCWSPGRTRRRRSSRRSLKGIPDVSFPANVTKVETRCS